MTAMEMGRVLENLRLTGGTQEARAGAERDLAGLYDAHASSLYRYLLTLLGNPRDAEDALQEVFLGVLRRRGLQGIRDPKAYLLQAARRQAFQVLRRRRRVDRESAAARLTWIDTEADSNVDRELALDVNRALIQLSAEHREVLELRLGEEMSFREIADVLRIPMNTAASRYRRALARLRQALREGDDDAR